MHRDQAAQVIRCSPIVHTLYLTNLPYSIESLPPRTGNHGTSYLVWSQHMVCCCYTLTLMLPSVCIKEVLLTGVLSEVPFVLSVTSSRN